MRRSSLLSVLTLTGALAACSDRDETPIITSIPVAPCGPDPALDELDVTVQGTVVDFLTGEPRAGVTVDVARVWEPEAVFPDDSCSVAKLTTDAAGRFGPVSVKLGPAPSLFESKYVLFLAQGDEISPTGSDNRVMVGSTIDHTIAAPSLELIDTWRSELDEGGMNAARTRGLVAYRYDEADGTPATGVIAQRATILGNNTLERGSEVRYLSADRATLQPVSRPSTTASGLALIGVAPIDRGTVEIAGARNGESWGDIGCLVGEGWVFLEWTRRIDR